MPLEQVTPDGSGGSDGGVETGAGTDLEGFYGQEVSWSECGDYECASIDAPLNWDDPEAGSISLALKRSVATGGDRIGSLLTNPGGPGGSGVDFLPDLVEYVLGPKVLASYDIIGFDPRGVGQSSAVDCGPDAEVDAFLTADTVIENQQDLDKAAAEAVAFGEMCAENTGDLLGHVDTVSAARDMDLIRAVLGDEELYYLGFSYGTFLGATYADLYPQNVGRLVLDGAIDPSLDGDVQNLTQAAGFEQALRAYVTDCMDGANCPLTGSVDDGMRQIADLVTRAESRPYDAGDGYVANGTMVFYGVIVTLYNDSYWSMLTSALTEVIVDHRASELYDYADYYLDRTPDGEYLTNNNLAFQAINCLDLPASPRDFEEMVAFRDEVAEVAPTFADWFSMYPGCENWPEPATGTPHEIHAPGAAPILVVGTTGDPATPYEWAQALAEQLDSGVLLSWDGEGHTAYGRGSSCVDNKVDTYLLTGATPEVGTMCD